MVSDAERFAEEDERRRQEVQTRNNAENLAYTAEKMLKDNAESIPEELKTEVEGKVAAVRSALQNNDIARIEATVNELQESLQKVGQAVYSQQQAGAAQEAATSDDEPPSAPGSDGSKSKDDDDTVEGKFREV